MTNILLTNIKLQCYLQNTRGLGRPPLPVRHQQNARLVSQPQTPQHSGGVQDLIARFSATVPQQVSNI